MIKTTPMFSESPLCVARKLEWNPLQPITPPPSSTKLEGLLWKNDWRTKRQPLQEKKNSYKENCQIISSKLQNMPPELSEKKCILLCWMLPQNNIDHSNCFLSMLWFLTFQSKCDCTHRNFCCERQPNFVRLCIVRSSDPFPVTSRWTVITRAAICRSPESTKMKLT